jgi:hypothetical protein
MSSLRNADQSADAKGMIASFPNGNQLTLIGDSAGVDARR